MAANAVTSRMLYLRSRLCMWTGRHFRLQRQVLAVTGSLAQKEDLQYIPAGDVVEVVSEPRREDTRFVDVQWNWGVYSVFSVDLVDRSEEIPRQMGTVCLGNFKTSHDPRQGLRGLRTQ